MSTFLDLRNYKNKMLALKDSTIEKLKKLPDGDLCIYNYVKNGKTYSSFRNKRIGNQRFVPITKDIPQIQGLAEKAFLEEKLKMIQNNIDQANNLIIKLEDLSASNIMQHLDPEIWPFLIFSEEHEYDLPSDPEVAKMITDWMNIPCPPSDYFPEELKHKTTLGFYVRTKSEAIWAEKLRQHRLPFKYELSLFINGEHYSPDFTVMRQDGKLVYIEHCGLMIKESYMKRHQKKMQDYYSVGIVPWDNLIITYDDKNGSIDVNLIEAEIQNKIIC